jgi:hypothetical protein
VDTRETLDETYHSMNPSKEGTERLLKENRAEIEILQTKGAALEPEKKLAVTQKKAEEVVEKGIYTNN